MDEGQAIVLDNGSGTIKAGFAGDQKPRVAIPAVLAWPRRPEAQTHLPKAHRNGFAISGVAEANILAAQADFTLKYVSENGVAHTVEGVEEIWRQTFADLGVPEGGLPMLVSEPPLSPMSHRELLVQLLFEEFRASSVCVAMSGILSLYSTGSRTGLVVEVGDSVAQIVPIYEEYVVPQAVHRLDCGGRDLTNYLIRLLQQERGYTFDSPNSHWYANGLKEQQCYVALNYKAELASACDNAGLERTVWLPDGNAVALGAERFRCAEALFNPGLINKESAGIHELVFQAINKSDVDTHRGLSGNIVLSGGTMRMQGFRQRMLKELGNLLPPSVLVKANVPDNPENAAFFGGSVLASVGEVQRNWVTMGEYEEHGASIIHSRSLCLTEGARRQM